MAHKRIRSETKRKEIFDELLSANASHLIVDPANSQRVIDQVCTDREGAALSFTLGPTTYSTANILAHFSKQVHLAAVTDVNLARQDEGLPPIPAFVNTTAPAKQARASGVASFFKPVDGQSGDKGRKYKTPLEGGSTQPSSPPESLRLTGAAQEASTMLCLEQVASTVRSPETRCALELMNFPTCFV